MTCTPIRVSAWILAVLLQSSLASAESVDPVDGGCFGGLDAGTCMYHSDCGPSELCYQGMCRCDISCGGSYRRHTCDDMGCFCEDRPTCDSHDDCSEDALCVLGQCVRTASCTSSRDGVEVCDEMGACRCERRPLCEYHADCGDVLCVYGQCLNEPTECLVDAEFHEACDETGCRCASRPTCRSHIQCEGEALCVGGWCNDSVSSCAESEDFPEEWCAGIYCRCAILGGGTPPRDAGTDPDAGRPPDAGAADAGVSGGGGGCSIHSGNNGALSFVFLLALLRRRRP